MPPHDARLISGQPPPPRLLTVANLLSLSRLPLGALFAWTLATGVGSPWSSLAVLILAAASDGLDGWFARRAESRGLGGPTPHAPAGMGAWLDPVCDKLFVSAVLAALWLHLRPPLAWLALILIRELAQLPLSLIYVAVPPLRRWLRYDFRASVTGKAATVLQFCALVALLFRSRASLALVLACSGVGVVALAEYVGRAFRMGRRHLAEQNKKKWGAP
ncbi:MAG TPA: CDP-alcohol phosphatidyltransferase family protein [Polyangia bacterium]|jgi:phosphatidylglycerophosphate synthase